MLAVLGVFVAESTVEGVLLRRAEKGEKIHIMGRYVRPRARRNERVVDLASAIPGLQDTSGSDFVLEVSDGPGQSDSDPFLAGELEALGVSGSSSRTETIKKPRRDASPIVAQLREILAECRKDGYPNPRLAFCVAAPDVHYQEIGVPVPRNRQTPVGSVRDVGISKAQRKILVNKLVESPSLTVDGARVDFVPMTDDQSRWRYLAVAGGTPDTVVDALDGVARHTKSAVPPAYLVDSELSLLASMVTRRPSARSGVVAIVRVGLSETSILFLRDGRLDRYEELRSVTSSDPLDTVCSRVLLKQDELRIGDIDEIYAVAEHHRDDVIESFQSFFPDSTVYGPRELLEGFEMAESTLPERVRAQTVPAVGVALRLLEDWQAEGNVSPLINILEKKRRGARTRRKLGLRWHSYAALLLLFGVSLFYTIQVLKAQEEVQLLEAEVALDPPEFPTEDPALLRSRVDSLQALSARYSRALVVLDSLLIGSDRWSTTLDRMTRATAGIGDIWLTAWTPDANMLYVEGNALRRSNIARFAQEWEGSIDKLTFAEIQGLRVYSFAISIPTRPQLPQVAEFLRENSAALDEADRIALEGLAETAQHTHESP